jgi:hypothetical protein
MDLFMLQKQMARDSDLGNGLGALSLGLSMSGEEQTTKRDRSTYYQQSSSQVTSFRDLPPGQVSFKLIYSLEAW